MLSSAAVEQSLLFGTCLLFKPCHADQVDALASFAGESLGGIDIWVNNAGLSQSSKSDIADTDSSLLQDIVGTNLLGTMWGSRAAIRSMKGTPSGKWSTMLCDVNLITATLRQSGFEQTTVQEFAKQENCEHCVL